MALLNFVLLDSTLLDHTSGELVTQTTQSYWVTIEQRIITAVKVGSLACELVMNGKGSLSFILLDPSPVPLCGQAVTFVDRGKLMFGGFIERISLNTDQAETVKEYTIECAAWDGQLERHLIKSSYTDFSVRSLIISAIQDGDLDDDGFIQGHLDVPPPILDLVDADYVRASDYLRDIATAGGGAIEISPEKVISFRKTALREAPFPLVNAEPEYVSTVDELDDYCNSMTVLVTGTGGATSTVTRTDHGEVAKRAAVEGTSGVYRAFERVSHPSSNDAIELTRLGVSVAFMFMQSRSRLNSKITARLRRNLLDVGQLLTVDMPGLNLDGQYQISRMSITDEEAHILFEIEATYTNKRQLSLDSLLKIVRASKTTIVLPMENFLTITEFTAPGSQTFIVPGTGTVQVEVEALGAGGGGAGGITLFNADVGSGRGGNGGRAVSFREYAAGTSLTVFVGTGGAGSTADGSAGTSSYVNSPTELRVVEGFGGAGGRRLVVPNSGNGADGLADGDFQFIGGGMAGGVSGIGNGNSGAAGQTGKVIIRT